MTSWDALKYRYCSHNQYYPCQSLKKILRPAAKLSHCVYIFLDVMVLALCNTECM